MPAKIVVTSVKGGSQISLHGSSGKQLLSSVVFAEPRAKGATLRALKGLLGETSVEDNTIRGPQRATAAATKATPGATVDSADAPVAPATRSKRASTKTTSSKATPKKAASPGATAPKAAESVASTSKTATSKAGTPKAAASKKSAPKTSPLKAASPKVSAASSPDVSATKVAAARKTTKRATARP